MASLTVSLSSIDIIKLSWTFISSRVVECYRRYRSEVETVDTNSGLVKGHKTASSFGYKYYNFHGIPYAKPPVGDLRFKVSQPVCLLAISEINCNF